MTRQTRQVAVDLDVLKKYSRPGPRYTSYPTAPHFHTGFTADTFQQEILAANQRETPGDLSLYLHFPFCRTLCYFCACNVLITHRPERIRRYLDYIKREIDLVSPMMHPDRRVVQMHWGGGTPNYLTAAQITEVFDHLKSRFQFADQAEISIEIDPRTVSRDQLSVIRENGFNRVSFGVQDVHPEVQKTINRIQTDETNASVIQACRDLGFYSINMDLMYGLPYQTIASYAQTLDKVLSWAPDRFAVFNYAHMPWLKKHQHLLAQETMPDTGERLEILKLIIERLTAAGYVYIGMDHFARPEDELARALESKTLYRNFQGYSTHAEAEVHALGMTAISQLRNVYAQNEKDLKAYEQRIDAGQLPTHVGITLNDDDKIRRYVITEIMCKNRVIKAEAEQQFGIDFDRYFEEAIARLDPFVEDGLLAVEPDGLIVLEAGRLVVRNIAMAFDAYLPGDQQKEKPLYSRTV